MPKFIYLFFFIFLSTCGSPEKKVVQENLPNEEEAVKIYKEGSKALEQRDYFFASKKFGEAEILLPQSDWAAKSALMIGYCLYSINFYDDAISFNQNISEWCVNHISSEPTNFDTGSPIDNTDNVPRWDRLCTPRVVLTHTNGGNYLLGPGAVLTITATFDQDMANSPQYSINAGSSYFDLTAGGNAATWTYLLDADSLPEGDHTFIVSGNGIDFDPSTHSSGATYNSAFNPIPYSKWFHNNRTLQLK